MNTPVGTASVISNLDRFDQWHGLFDALCNESGFLDNGTLASEYCAIAGGNGQADYETAVRNLANWRTGRHIPRRRNFTILGQILNVARQSELEERWTELYASAREQNAYLARAAGTEVEDLSPDFGTFPPADPYPRVWTSRQMTVASVGALIVGAVVGATSQPLWQRAALPDLNDLPLVTVQPFVKVYVGESRIIHAQRGDCGQLPPEWEYVQTRLPKSSIGTFSDGGLVRRSSDFCKGETPGRAVIFKGEKTGREDGLVLGDPTQFVVEAPPQ